MTKEQNRQSRKDVPPTFLYEEISMLKIFGGRVPIQSLNLESWAAVKGIKFLSLSYSTELNEVTCCLKVHDGLAFAQWLAGNGVETTPRAQEVALPPEEMASKLSSAIPSPREEEVTAQVPEDEVVTAQMDCPSIDGDGVPVAPMPR